MERVKSVMSVRPSEIKTPHGRSKDTISKTSSKESFMMEFEDFIQYAITQFGCPISVTFVKDYHREAKPTHGKHTSKLKRRSLTDTYTTPADSFTSTTTTTTKPTGATPVAATQTHNDLIITVGFDIFNRLTELLINRYQYQTLPRTLIQILGLAIQHQKQLVSFTIKHCRIDMYTVYELSKLLSVSHLTDICLDHCPLKEGNYDILLKCSYLHSLSLARCNINDVVCSRIAAKLHFPQPAQRSLTTLNLASNDITNEGAKSFAVALRSNRHLRYLNLSDNHVEDEGACSILDSLKEFRLTLDEREENRMRHLKYLKQKVVIYNKCMEQLLAKQEDQFSKKVRKVGKNYRSPVKRPDTRSISRISNVSTSTFHCYMRNHRSSSVMLTTKAALMCEELLGPLEDPFLPRWINSVGKELYCTGNFALCYLNFAYNNLTYVSVRKLRDVVSYQRKYTDNKLCGIMKVLLDGNYIPKEYEELDAINEILKMNLDKYDASLCVRRRTKTNQK